MSKLIEITFFRKILELFCFILGIINQIIPKNDKRILFFNSKTDYFNNYALYKYVLDKKYNQRYRIYYYMPGIKSSEKAENNVFLIESSVKVVWLYLTTKFCFFDTGNMRIRPSKTQKVINLWHGTPLKRIGFLSKSAEKSLPKNMMNTFTAICVASSAFDDIYVKSFNLKQNQIIHCGQPRMDCLKNTKDALRKIGVKKQDYEKVIMWMTTYRISKDGRLRHIEGQSWNETNLPLLSSLKKLEEFNIYLCEENMYLLIKIHRTSVFDKKNCKKFSNIQFVFEEDFIFQEVQLYEILGECNALITDYSSVYFDYLVLNRPICFIIEDIEEYERVNGFTIENPKEYMPGAKITTIEQLKTFCMDLKNNKDLYVEQRISVSKWCNEYLNNNNSETLLKKIGLV